MLEFGTREEDGDGCREANDRGLPDLRGRMPRRGFSIVGFSRSGQGSGDARREWYAKPDDLEATEMHAAVAICLLLLVLATAATAESLGIVVTPDSMLLPAGTRALSLTVTTPTGANCRYSIGEQLPYARMTPLSPGGGRVRTLEIPISPDPATLNHVYLSTSASSREPMHLIYRCLPSPRSHFPRVFNLWGSWAWVGGGHTLEEAAKIDLWLGASFDGRQIATLRRLSPGVLILCDINAVENNDVPDDFFLRDVNGRKIEVWPGSYRLNLTRPEVARYQAEYARKIMLENNLMFDGCFFDNVMLSQSWQRTDIYGNPVAIDADGDGKADDPAKLDAAWRAGVLLEMRTWHELMPHAFTSAHSLGSPDEPGVAGVFNGMSIGFSSVDVIEGRMSFSDFWSQYHDWCERSLQPTITSVESAIPAQIGYGYGFDAYKTIPASTLEFGRTYYPYMRFGLAFTLMGDGYFAQEAGDTGHGNAWWYDELDYDLGEPLGEARCVGEVRGQSHDLVTNGGFERPLARDWSLWADASAGCAATVKRDPAQAQRGGASARIMIANAGRQADWQIDFSQPNRALTAHTSYALTFWAKADAPRLITLSASKGAPPWDSYGLGRTISITADWRQYRVTFEAPVAARDARIQFLLGASAGSVWLDDVSLTEAPPPLYRRDFSHGTVLLNGSREPQTISVGPGYRRLQGAQAPRYQYILDNVDAGFTTGGESQVVTLDSGMWKAAGPYYHNWGKDCRLLARGAEASWNLGLPASDLYTIQAWWPAAPTAGDWSRSAVFEVVAGGKVVHQARLDQTTGGDEWHTVADKIALQPGDHPRVRVRADDGRPCLADALHIYSASRYNDGSPAMTVTLAPMDGIVLLKDGSR
jgi:hypothetical protein